MKTRKVTAFLLALAAAASAMTMPVSAVDMFGDIDADGDVDAADAAWILQYAAYTGAGGKLDLQGFVNGEPEPEQPDYHLTDTDDTLTILTWRESDAKAMQELYQKHYPEAKIEFIVPVLNGMDAKNNFARIVQDNPEIDLYFVETDWCREFIDDPELSVPLSALGLTENDYISAYPFAQALGTNANGELAAAAAELAPGVYCYNTDIAEQYLGVKTPAEMEQEFSIWDDFLNMGSILQRESEGRITVAASMSDLWNAFTCCTDMPWVTDGKLNLDKAEYCISWCRQFMDEGSISKTTLPWTPEWSDAGLNSETLGYFYASWCLGDDLMLEQNGGANGNWRAVPVPTSYYWGGTYLCISPNCDSSTEAARFMKCFTTDAATMKEYSDATGIYVNNQTAVLNQTMEQTEGNPLLGGQKDLSILHRAAQKITADPTTITKYDEELENLCYLALMQNPDESVEKILEIYADTAYAEFPELEAE